MKYRLLLSFFLSTLSMLLAIAAIAFAYHSDKLFQPVSTAIPISSFTVVQGSGFVSDGSMIIDSKSGNRTIISNLNGIENADNYQHLSFDLTASQLFDNTPLFFWRTAANGQIHSLALEENPIDHLLLADEENWHGKISEYGFIFTSNHPLSWELKNVIFSSAALDQIMLSTVSGWLKSEPWSLRSVNFISDGSAKPLKSALVFITIWSLLTLLIFALLSLLTGKTMMAPSLLMLFIVAWIALDARWLFKLFQQAQITQNSYVDDVSGQIPQSETDTDYYRFFQHLKNKLLPPSPQIIYVLDTNGGYFRAKTPWWLAPHNVLNIDSLPRPEYEKKGGYVLLLHPIPGMRFDQSRQALYWGKNHSLAVEPLYLSPLGALYKIKDIDG